MKISKITGCTTFSLNVDEKEEVDMTNEERLVVIDNICTWMKRHPEQLNYVLQGLTEYCGEYKTICSEPCECCGDTIDAMILDLNV